MGTAPEEYLFLQRYPPAHAPYTGEDAYSKVETKRIPYLELYEKAMESSPVYEDKAYPAYWTQVPNSLVLAKKQYQYMQEGIDEKEAFKKAEHYIKNLENKSYLELKKLNSIVEKSGAQASYMSDEAVVAEILYWQDKVKDVAYDELDLADQGEIDYFIQTKVLKWNEVERERRMKDFAFVQNFERLRDLIIPDKHVLSKTLSAANMAKNERVKSACLLDMYAVDYSLMKTATPFYLEDYLEFFAQLQAEPSLRNWQAPAVSNLVKWMMNALVVKEISTKVTHRELTAYLQNIRNDFFPMAVASSKTPMKIPTVEEIKKALYENDVGYKNQDGKTYVRRFYKLPGILFPNETFANTISRNEADLK
jgi:hypothetical protein